MKHITTVLIALLMAVNCFAQQAISEDLEQNFINPPSSAKPITWMHVMSDSMSKEVMTKDLEAIADVKYLFLLQSRETSSYF